jgi:xanthine/CO dehydrogenase XdhC/CoxF family maturation factor
MTQSLPFDSGSDDVLATAAKWKAAGKKVALATVVTTWGSSPRPEGSQLAIDETGAFVGSVSGGCIEGAVVKEGLAAMKDGKPRLLDFGVSNEQAWEVGLACGGKVQVFVERVE